MLVTEGPGNGMIDPMHVPSLAHVRNGGVHERLSIRSGDVSLVGESFGAPSAPPVLFLHGGGQTRGSWKRTLPVVAARGFRAIAFDARGHGESDWSREGHYTLAAFARDLETVVATLSRPPVLVGASLGGLTALLFLGGAPVTAARGLVLVDVTPRADRGGVARIRQFMSASPNGFRSVEDAAEAVARYAPHRSAPSSPEGLRRNLRLRGGRYHWHWDPLFIGDGKQNREIPVEALEAAARALRIPALLVHAQKSDIVTEKQVVELRGLMPEAEYVCVPGTGHMVVGDANDVFNTGILDFLEKKIGAPTADRS